MKWFLVALVLFPIFSFAENVRFYNFSDHPVLAAGAHFKDDSVAGLNNSGYDDPLPFTHTEGYFTIAPGRFKDFPRSLKVDYAGQKMTATLGAIRAHLLSENGNEKIIHPKEKTKSMYLAVGELTAPHWYWNFPGTREPFTLAIEEARKQGHEVREGTFYAIEHFSFTDTNGNAFYGVGAKGTESRKIIDTFWATNAVFTGTVFRVFNGTGVKQDFEVQFFDNAKNDFIPFADFKAAGVGGKAEWKAGPDAQVTLNPDGTSRVIIRGRNFNGDIRTWGPGFKVTPVQELRDGRRTVFYNMTVN